MRNRSHDIRIFVVDNNSSSDQVAILHNLAKSNPSVQIILNSQNAGYFPGLNIGIKTAKETGDESEWFIIGNNDLIFEPDFLNNLDQRKDHFKNYSVISPDIVTLDKVHQNPHVISKINI